MIGPAAGIRVAVDIGGTFTDLECIDPVTGVVRSFKTPTTPEDPALGLVNALNGAAERFGFHVRDVSLLLHGTTIATNAVLTRDLPHGALITNAGFEDVLEIGRHARRDIYGLKAEERTVLIPRRHRFGIIGRISAKGDELAGIDPAAIDAVIDQVVASGAEVVAISLLNAFSNPVHECLVRDRLRQRLPSMPCSCSHEVSPEIREFERTSTTVLNSLLMPVVQRYVRGLETRARAAGLSAPIYLVQSNGGATTPAAASVTPVKLLLSGPSGGVLAARQIASELGFRNAVAVDMGGTSYDIAIIQNGEPSFIAQGDVDGLPIRVPMVDMRTIGAGGGSIVALDASGRLMVGPASAGATPGPVCYRRGGIEPTVTDVNVVLGRIGADSFMGGQLPLDREGAARALDQRVARPLGLSVDAAASGVLAVVVAKLAGAIKLSLFEKGLDPRDFVLISFGGAGGVHAVEVAAELGITTVVFPREPSTFSAHGILQSDVVQDLAHTRIIPLIEDAATKVATLVSRMTLDGTKMLADQGLAADACELRFSVDLRYRGQAFEIMVPLGPGPVTNGAITELVARFHAAHRQRFSFDDPLEVVELVTLRLAAIGRLPMGSASAVEGPRVVASRQTRAVHLGGCWQHVPVIPQQVIGAGDQVAGPAIIEQPYTTLLLGPGWTLEAQSGGDLVARSTPGTAS